MPAASVGHAGGPFRGDAAGGTLQLGPGSVGTGGSSTPRPVRKP